LQILPLPTTAQGFAVKVTFVTDQVALHPCDSGSGDAIGEIVDAFEVIAVVEARGD